MDKKEGLIRYHISGEISEEEIQKAIEDYKKSVKTETSGFTDAEIRDMVIKSLVRHDVGLQSYSNPETLKLLAER